MRKNSTIEHRFVNRLTLVLLAVFGSVPILAGDSMAVGGARPDLYGTWDLFEVQGSGMAARVRLTIEDGIVTNSTSCSVGEKSVHVKASSTAVITHDEILILEDSRAQKDYEPGVLNCKVSLDKGAIRYEMIEGHLVLRMAGQDEVIELSRSGATFMQARRLASTSR